MSESFTKGMARNIYYGGSVFFFLIFLALTFHTVKEMPKRDNRHNITEAVERGKHLWEKKQLHWLSYTYRWKEHTLPQN